LKQWKNIYLDGALFLVARSNWNAATTNQNNDRATTIEMLASPLRLQPRIGVGYRW